MFLRTIAFGLFLGFITILGANEPQEKKSPRKALQPISGLIGPWLGTGTPSGTKEEKQKGFWSEKMEWSWKFKDKDAWFAVEFEKSKNYTSGELRYDADKDNYVLKLKTVNKDEITFVGTVETRDKTKILTLEREDGKDTQRLVVKFLHDDFIRYHFEVKPDGKNLFAKKWDVGAKRDGVPFVGGDGKPECIVSGGTGTIAVSFMGKTYYVCCSGCRDEFNAAPAKYVREWEEKQAKKKK
jgi:YHS domain-containing protein